MISGSTFTTFDPGSSGSAARLSERSGKPQTSRYYGKYRGKVLDNIDPLFLGRIMAIVPAISPEPLTWAMPCVPYAGPEVGFYAIPPIDANVWVEFEGGDPDAPIWTGCFWEEGQVPLGAPPPGTTILKTECITLILRDIPGAGGLSLEIIDPAVDTPISVNMDSAGIQVTTEATLTLTSEETNVTTTTLTIEASEANISGDALTIESLETNISGDALTIESDATNITSDVFAVETDETNILSDALTIESLETNFTSASFDVEAADTNIAGAVTVEGAMEVSGAILEDGAPVMIVPV
jgi:hypothetical protein